METCGGRFRLEVQILCFGSDAEKEEEKEDEGSLKRGK